MGANTVHIALGGSAFGNVRELINRRPSEMVLSIDDCYSIGPLFNIAERSGIDAREAYIRQMFNKIRQPTAYEAYHPHIGLADLLNVPQDTLGFVVWCGSNADEQILLRAACANLGEIPITVADVGASDFFDRQRSAVGGCNRDTLVQTERRAILLSADEKEQLSAEWRNLISQHQLLRVFSNATIQSVGEDFFDQSLVDFCPEEFGPAAQLVGRVMGYSDLLIGDTFLNYRLRELIAQGMIDALDAETQLQHLQVRRAR